MIGVYDASEVLGIYYSSAWLAGIACVFTFTIRFIKNYIYVTVNCWFCNISIKVPFKSKNDWVCPHCEQFNGFKEDGDYTKPIPAQYNEKLNVNYSRILKSASHNYTKPNGLCRTCNANQELKIRQLALYVPLKEENYNDEIDLFSRHLENSYKLCLDCENVVRQTLKQKSNFFPPLNTTEIPKNVSKKPFSLSGKFICGIFIMSGLLTALLWENYPQHFCNLAYIIKTLTFSFHEYLNQISNLQQDFIISYVLAICIAVTVYYSKQFKFLSSFIIGLAILLISDYVSLNIQILGIISCVIYLCFKYCKRQRENIQLMNTTYNSLKNISNEFNLKKENMFNNGTFSTNVIPADVPIRRQFSDLNLGESNGIIAKPSSKTSYLFKSTKTLIRPSKLKVDDFDSYSTDSSPSVFSTNSQLANLGFDSSCHLKKSPRKLLDFDSISQISSSVNNDYDYRRQTNAIAHYFQYRSYLQAPDRCFGVSPVYPPANFNDSSFNSSQQIQANSCFSFLQILLCSIAFFILGFFFQLFVSRF